MNSFPVNGIHSRLATRALSASLICTLVSLAGAHTLHAGVAQPNVSSAQSPAPQSWFSASATLPIRIERSSLGLDMSVAAADVCVVENAGSVFDLSAAHTASTASTEVCVGDEAVPAASSAPLTTASTRVIVSSGAIEADVAEFRALLGNPNNGAALGQQPAGRREVNWDGVPVGLTNTKHFPTQFFNGVSPRGLVYQQGLRGLEVSDNGFVNINPAYAGEFLPFSGHKLFSPLGTNESDALFFVAGTHIEAGVRGFGIVFSDVDKEGTTGIKLLDANDDVIETVIAPARSDRRGLSFVGVVLRNPVITHVHIVAGDARLGLDELDVSQGGQHDLVVMDDFIYGEPMATGN